MTPRLRTDRSCSSESECSKSVHFGKVVLIEFMPALGDNPSVSCGVPVTLSLQPFRSREIPIDRFERHRSPRRRRNIEDLIIAVNVREKMYVHTLLRWLNRIENTMTKGTSIHTVLSSSFRLLNQGYQEKDINRAIRTCTKARHEREYSQQTQHLDGYREKAEMSSNKFFRLFGLRR
jgi:hypothetical protein